MPQGGGFPAYGTEGWFYFTAPHVFTRVSVKPDVSMGSGAVPYMGLFDNTGTYVAQAAPGTGNASVIDSVLTPGQTYYLAVADFGPASATNRTLRVWFSAAAAPQEQALIQDYGIWKSFSLPQYGTKTKLFDASMSVPYTVYWNDSYHGDGTKSKDIYVAGWNNPLTTAYFPMQDSGYYEGEAPSFTPSTNDQVNLIVSEYAYGSAEGTYALKIVPLAVSNPLFSHWNATNWTGNGIYGSNAAADKTTYLNVPSTGDYLPGWKFDFDANSASTNGGVQIDVSTGDVRLVGGVTSTGYNGWDTTMTQDGIRYTTTSSTRLDLSFKINSYGGGSCYSPYYEAPVKVFLKFNDTWHLLMGFTTQYADYPNRGYLEYNTSVSPYVELAYSYTVDGFAIPAGTVIQGVQVQCNGWYWDVDLYSIQLNY